MKRELSGRKKIKTNLTMGAFTGMLALSMSVFAGFGNGSDIDYTEVPGEKEFTGQMIVRPYPYDNLIKKGMSKEEAVSKINAAHDIISEKFDVIEYVWQTDEYIISVPRGETENTVADKLMSIGVFQYAEPNWMLYPLDCPNDSRFNNQWHHNANRMQSCDAWTLHTGNPSVSVGICDTGILTTHEDFQLHRLEGYNAVDRKWESNGGNIGPVHSHGTQTSGCAAANGNNGVGVSGMGWDLSHRMLRVTNSSGGGAYMSDLQHAARTSIESGDRVASVSYSGVDTSSNLTTATYIKSINGLLVWAAGNDGRNLTYGNRDNDDIIVVGATDSNDSLAYFSAYGQFVDVTAPGVSVYTTSSSSNSSYASVSGTSFACPLTAGSVAMIWSYNPSLTPDEVETILKQGCDDLGSNGVDNTYGYGRVNIYGSLSQGGGPGNEVPIASLSASPTSGTAPLLVDFNASASYDNDGYIANYEWDWEGDGVYDASTGTNPYASHTYNTANQYNATVRVTDDQGATDTDFVVINVNPPANDPPVAQLSANPTFGTAPLNVNFDASTSYDNDGSIVNYEWDYDGDGIYDNSTGANPYSSTTYTIADVYNATVRVTDDRGDSDTDFVTITVNAPSNYPPVADISANPSFGTAPLDVNFDASGSYDVDGSIVDYSWDYDGDGIYDNSTGTSAYSSATYSVPDQYNATVRVTDNDGAIDTASVTITVNAPTNDPPVAVLSANPTNGTAPLNVDFNASGSYDLDGTIVDYSWDYDGDGNYDASTGTNPYSAIIYDVADQYNATVRVTDNDGAIDTAFVTITVNSGGGDPTSLAFDGFESRNYSGGTGNWNGSWSASGDVSIRWRRDNPHTGNGHVRLRRNTGYLVRSADLAGATSVKLTFWAKVYSFERSDELDVLVSSNGSNYSTVMTFDRYDSDNQYHYYEIDLSGFQMTSDFRIAFDANMNSTGDRFYVDDIDIIGVP